MRRLIALPVVAAVALMWWAGERQQRSRSDLATPSSERTVDSPASAGNDASAASSRLPTSRWITTTFRVVSASAPVPGAAVSIPARKLVAVTDANGIAEIRHRPFSDEFFVRKFGYQTATGYIGLARPLSGPIELKPGTSMRGRVVDAETRRGIAGATVHALHDDPIKADDSKVLIDVPQRTDERGGYQLAGVGGSRLRLVASALGYAARAVTVSGDELPDLILGGDGEVRGQVSGPDGSPVSDAAVVVWPRVRRRFSPDLTVIDRTGESPIERQDLLYATTLTDREGRYRIRGLRLPGRYELMSIKRGVGTHVSDGLVLSETRKRQVRDLRLVEPASLRLEFGVDAVGVDARIAHSSDLDWNAIEIARRERDATGLTFTDVWPGPLSIQLTKSGYVERRRNVRLDAGAHRVIRVEWDAGHSLDGVVLNDEGEPVVRAYVMFIDGKDPDESDAPVAHTSTGDRGEFRFEGLRGTAGTIRVDPGRRTNRYGRDFLPFRGGPLLPQAALRIRLDVAPRIVFHTEPPNLAVFSGRGGRESGVGRVEVTNGIKYLVGLPAGVPLAFNLRASGLAPVRLETGPLDPGETRDLGLVRFGLGGSLAGVVRAEGGAAVPHARVRVETDLNEVEEHADHEGRFLCGSLGPGERRVTVKATGFLPHSVVLPVDESTQLVKITLQRFGILSCRVLDREGEPTLREDWEVEIRRDEDGETIRDPGAGEVDVGRYEARLPAGRYRLRIRRSGDGPDDRLPEVPFELRAREVTELEVRLR